MNFQGRRLSLQKGQKAQFKMEDDNFPYEWKKKLLFGRFLDIPQTCGKKAFYAWAAHPKCAPPRSNCNRGYTLGKRGRQ
jgi:hypothetical protein